MATIASKVCVTERGARNIVRRLEADGWLQTQVGRGRGGCNTYQILMSNKAPFNPGRSNRHMQVLSCRSIRQLRT